MSETSRKNYLLLVLIAIAAFNGVDRVALGLMSQDIKRDLFLTDTQLGALTGIAFALFYSVMGIPLARWADSGNRVTITALTTGLWSVGVALCAGVGSFAQLLLVRVCVAVGEAGCIPTANSLIADYFSRVERPRAAALYLLGGPLSMVLGYFVGGWLDQSYGWRGTFVALGLPGVGLAILAKLTLVEPRATSRTAAASARQSAHSPEVPLTAREVTVTLLRNRTFRNLLLSYSVAAFFGYGVIQWLPAFFIRSFGIRTVELGTWLALIYGVGGSLATYWGGDLVSRYAANNERIQLRAMAALYVGLGVLWTLVYTSPNRYAALGLTALTIAASCLCGGPLLAVIQSLVPERMRAQSIALIYLFANLIGMGLGPLTVGTLSDTFHAWAGEEALRYALLALCPGYVWAAWHAWRASTTVQEDLQVEIHARDLEEAESSTSAPPDIAAGS